MTCAAWLVGDERRIAKDAVVWIPELPDDILRHGLRRPHRVSSEGVVKKAASTGEAVAVDEEDPDDEDDAEEAEDPVPFGRPKSRLGRQRCERDLRTLADACNEWFPCFEFSGSCLTFDDLVVWDVVKPEWCFGGRGVRNRPEAPANAGRTNIRVKESRALEGLENSGKTAAQAPVHCGKVDLDGQKLEQSTKGEHAPSKDASEGSDASSEPQTATKPSDL
jgi:hypothetical protein